MRADITDAWILNIDKCRQLFIAKFPLYQNYRQAFGEVIETEKRDSIKIIINLKKLPFQIVLKNSVCELLPCCLTLSGCTVFNGRVHS